MNKYYLIIFILIVNFAQAESFVYITDQVDIPIRKDKNFKDNIIESLSSGSKMSILQTTSDGWTQVKYKNIKGWVISRYLSNTPPARKQLEKLKIIYNANKLLVIKQSKKNKALEKTIKKLKIENKNLLIQINKSLAEKKHIEKTYADALKLEHSNEKLNTEILQLKSTIQLLENNNKIDKDSISRNWFIVGGIVMFFGVILGLILPNFTKKRKF